MPAEVQQWMNIFRRENVRERICSTVEPISLLDKMPSVLKLEQEEWVKQTKENEGNTRACRLLVKFIISSENRDWPNVLLTALEEANNSILADFLRNEYEASFGTKCELLILLNLYCLRARTLCTGTDNQYRL